ncbi:nSTAND1 domain-containing NTPase [Lyngbya confervoides]|uniref:SH3 domain-containing protein n=1 Tax=Lyngbya confervoides BDU141951 TaxID=1574623 RepID=A0ABD4T5Y2_9CYAN|nr:SH3 domain-containing protein [Lyngbya confervoides]MCM1983903.1 SH3 domain-containing protein [Lyngbya confervoides BDU141951]
MNHPVPPPEIPAKEVSFPSFSAMRIAHRALLQKFNRIAAHKPLFSEIKRFILQGRETGTFLDNDEDRLAAQGLLDYWNSVLLRANCASQDVSLAEFDIALAPLLADQDCPYRGLNAFGEGDAPFFFGRRRMVKMLLTRLQSQRLLPVVGSSGSGKSSIVLGGLIPNLKAGGLDHSDQWHYFPAMVPGNDPIRSLVKGLCPPDQTESGWIESQTLRLSHQPGDLPDLIRELSAHRPAVLVMDQFEEVFTLCQQAHRSPFIDSLVALLEDETKPQIYLILTMRSDFENKVALLSNFYQFFETAQIRVLPLNAAELRDAIQKPAEKVGLKFEEGVVDRLIADVLGEPAALPLLQFVLLKLWEQREQNVVTYSTYQNLGGAREALAHSADEFYNQLIPEDRETAKRILLRMVRVNQGLEVTSQRIVKEDLYSIPDDNDRIDRVLSKLDQVQLIRQSSHKTAKNNQIEISHEALIRNWPRFLGWIEDERVSLRRRSSLSAAAEQWKERQRDPNVLLRGSLLEEAQTYTDLNDLESRFVQRSQQAAQMKTRMLTGAVISVGCLLLGLSLFATFKWREAEAARQKTDAARKEVEYERNEIRGALEALQKQTGKIEEINRIIQELEAKQIEEQLALEKLQAMNASLLLSSQGSQTPQHPTAYKVTGPTRYLRNVRQGPGTDHPVLYQLRGNTPIQVLDNNGRDRGNYRWYKIKAPAGYSQDGWIAAHLVDAIP